MPAAKLERNRRTIVKDFGDVLGEAEALLRQAAKETGDKASDLRSQVEAKLTAGNLCHLGAGASLASHRNSSPELQADAQLDRNHTGPTN